MDEAKKRNSFVSTMLTLLIILSPLEHIIGVEKIFYTIGLLGAALSIIDKKKIALNETCALLLFLGYAFLLYIYLIPKYPGLQQVNTDNVLIAHDTVIYLSLSIFITRMIHHLIYRIPEYNKCDFCNEYKYNKARN